MTRTFSTRLLNRLGDVVITWTESEDEEIIAKIQKKMDEGVVFFLIEGPNFNTLPPNKTKLERASDAIRTRAVEITGTGFDELFESGKMAAQHDPATDVKTTGKTAKTAAEVAQNDTVAVQPRQGG